MIGVEAAAYLALELSTARVLARGDQLHVVGIHAGPHAAEVVDLKEVRDRTDKGQPDCPMAPEVALSTVDDDPEPSVPVTVHPACP